MQTAGTLFETHTDRVLARLHQVMAQRHSGIPITNRQHELLRQIEARKGKGAAIGTRDLCERLHCTRRELSDDVREMRLLGVAIGSSRDCKDGGYFLIVTEQELREFLAQYLNQARSELRLVRAVGGCHYALDFLGQLNLELQTTTTEAA